MEPVVDASLLDLVLAEVVNTREKLEVVVRLHHARVPLDTAALSASAELPWVVVAEALGELQRAGIVSTSNEDGASWWLDDVSAWREVVAVLARIHERDRRLLLRRMSRLALKRFRAMGHTDVPHVIRLRFKYEP